MSTSPSIASIPTDYSRCTADVTLHQITWEKVPCNAAVEALQLAGNAMRTSDVVWRQFGTESTSSVRVKVVATIWDGEKLKRRFTCNGPADYTAALLLLFSKSTASTAAGK